MKQHRITILRTLVLSCLILQGCGRKQEKRLVPPVRVYSYEETQKDITVKVSSELCDKQIYKKNTLLRKYQPIEITIVNNSNEQIELAAYNIGVHFHSLNHILKKTPVLGTGRKLLLIADAAGIATSSALFLSSHVAIGAMAGTFFPLSIWAGAPLSVAIPMVAPFLIAPFLLLDTFIHAGKINTQKNKIKRHLRRTIFEPSQTLILDPHTSIRKSVFCPHKFMKQYFNITCINTQTFEPYIFNVSLKEQI